MHKDYVRIKNVKIFISLLQYSVKYTHSQGRMKGTASRAAARGAML
jgi:hypothetical protein